MKVLVRTSQQPDYNAVPVNIDPVTSTVSMLRQIAAKHLGLPRDCEEYTVLWAQQTLGPDMPLSVLGLRSTDIFVLDWKASTTSKRPRDEVAPHPTPGPALTGRLLVPLLYGSEAFWQGPKAPPHGSHRWTVFVRSPNEGSLLGIVERVHFFLHSSFTYPERVVAKTPFEVHEVGWGEFVVGIHVYFVGVSTPFRTTHFLSLFPKPLPNPPSIPSILTGDKVVPLVTARPRDAAKSVLPGYVDKPVMSHVVEDVVILQPPPDLVSAVARLRAKGPIQGEADRVAELQKMSENLELEILRLHEVFNRRNVDVFVAGGLTTPAYQ